MYTSANFTQEAYDSATSRTMLSHTCQWCHKEFFRNKHRIQDDLVRRKRTPGAFCSYDCKTQFGKQQKQIKKETTFLTCKKCGTKFIEWRGYIAPNKYTGDYCSSLCSHSRDWLPEHKARMSQVIKNGHASGRIVPHNKGRTKKPPITLTCNTCQTDFQVPAYKHQQKSCSIKCAQQRPGAGGYRPNSTRKHRSEYKGYWMDSGSERKFAELLDEHQIRWIKNTTQFFVFSDTLGTKRKYYPDFFLPDYNHWVEIKGRLYAHGNNVLQLGAVVGATIELQYHDELQVPSVCLEAKK